MSACPWPRTRTALPRSLPRVEAAVTARDRIIEMATLTSAAALGLTGETGRLAPGYSTDLLVVDGDPLTGLNALHNRRLVVFQGNAG